MDLLGNEIGLWFSALSCTTAAVLVAWGAQKGDIRHRFPRVLVAVAVIAIAVSYWIDLIHAGGAVDLRRGAGWLLWPSLAWTAWTGVVYSRGVVRAEDTIRELGDG